MKKSDYQIRNLLSGLFVIILLSSSISSVTAQTIKADSVKFPIGSQVKVTLEVPFNDNDKVTWPVFGDTITKSIEIVSKSKTDTVKDDASSQKFLRQILTITSFDTGFVVFPPVPFTIVRNGQTESVKTEALLLEVYKVKVDLKADIKDIKPIIKAPISFRELLPYIAGALILGALIYGVIYYLRKRKKAPEEKPQPKITIPPWEIALQKLNVLKNEQIWQKGDIKEYYTRLTDILREYFDARYNVNAAEMTSSEILDAMKPHITDEKPMASLQNILFLSDMAKFAKAQPGAYENEQSTLYSFEFINNTVPAQGGGSSRVVNHQETNKKSVTE